MSYPSLPLKQGSKGPAVFQVQRALRAREIWVDADSDYGPKTKAAVTNWEKEVKRHVDGEVSKDDWNNLFPTISTSNSHSWPGATKALKTALNHHGYHLPVNSDLGGQAVGAIKQFQKQHNLTQDGVVGPQTWYVLLGGKLPMPNGAGGRGMQPSPEIAAAIGQWEGGQSSDGLFHVHQDMGGVWTIGYGDTIGVGPNTGPWTKQQALNALHDKLNNMFAPPVRAVGVQFNQKQFDALLSFTYNVGSGAISAGSSVGNALRQHNFPAAMNALMSYSHVGSKYVPGLARRRTWEKQLFNGGSYGGI